MHTWQKIDHKTDTGWPKMVGQWKCTTCGMKKSKFVAKDYVGFIHDRSGQVFSTSKKVPECINWEEENNKTID